MQKNHFFLKFETYLPLVCFKTFANWPFLQMKSPGEKSTGLRRRTSSQRNPASVFWKISTRFKVSRWTLIAISAFSLSKKQKNQFLVTRKIEHMQMLSEKWNSGRSRKTAAVRYLYTKIFMLPTEIFASRYLLGFEQLKNENEVSVNLQLFYVFLSSHYRNKVFNLFPFLTCFYFVAVVFI